MNVFHQNAPRSSVVSGEETEPADQISSGHLRLVQLNPVLTPRSFTSLCQHSVCDDCTPLGFGSEGRNESPRAEGGKSIPNCLAWAKDLKILLNDKEGATLFQRYLEDLGQDDLDDFFFVFACNGLRRHTSKPPKEVSKLVEVIYNKYFVKSCRNIDKHLKKEIHKRFRDPKTPRDIYFFDDARKAVEELINRTTYRNFLQSDIYLQYVQDMQNCCSGSGEANAKDGPSIIRVPSSSGGLATLHEDQELETPSYAPLTKDMLYITQKRRAAGVQSRTEAFVGLHNIPGRNRGGSRVYSSYNPVSQQDSELPSTESDSMSLADSKDCVPVSTYQKVNGMKFLRHINKDPSIDQTIIPRPQRNHPPEPPVDPKKFASILTEKLENLIREQEIKESRKREQEKQEKLRRKLLEAVTNEGQKSLVDYIQRRFQNDEDNDQDILDQHVSRVWNDSPASRTPGIASPRQKSPEFRRNRPNQPMNKVCAPGSGTNVHHPIPHPYQSTRPYSSRHSKLKEKDVSSIFSSDSGNVSDYRLHLPKSKSMPDYSESSEKHCLPNHDGRFVASRGDWTCTIGRKHNKKPEFIDSGVSVVSETASNYGYSLPTYKDSRVLSWLIDSDRNTSIGFSHSERDSASSCSGGSRFDTKYHTRGRHSPPPPGESFITETSLQPSVLPEERPRLDEQARYKQIKQRCTSSSLMKSDPVSVSSTLKKSKSTNDGCYTTVMFSFCDEQFPYRTKIPGQSITLRQFKEFLPKKGNYRYYFKLKCEELDMVIQEEIMKDNDILPLWEGKIMAQIKPVE